MRAPISIALLLLAAATPARSSPRDTVEREFAKTLPLAAGKRLSVEHANGDVVVKTHAAPEVKVHAVIRVSSTNEDEAKRFADQITIEATSEPAGVLVKTTYPESSLLSRGRRVSYSVDYDILMPEGAALTAQNRFGGILVSGVKGGTQVENANGRVVLKDVGGTQRVSNSFGAVEITTVAGDVDVTNGNGSVIVSDVKGAAELKTRFGKIHATKVTKNVSVVGGNGDVSLSDCGPTTVNTSFGKVEARNIAGDLDVESSNGSVDAANVTGVATLKTSFGALRFTDVRRAVGVASNSSVIVTKVKEGANVRNSFGSVELSDIGGAVEVENANGGIKASRLRAGARLKTSFGLIQAEEIDGDLQADNSNGSITARAVKGAARAKTSFGSVTLAAIGGDVSVDDSNGSVDFKDSARAGNSCRRVALKTSFGAVKAESLESQGYAVDARTSFGAIDSELPLTASQRGNNLLTGKIGDGRCPLLVTNSNGRIDLLSAR